RGGGAAGGGADERSGGAGGDRGHRGVGGGRGGRGSAGGLRGGGAAAGADDGRGGLRGAGRPRGAGAVRRGGRGVEGVGSGRAYRGRETPPPSFACGFGGPVIGSPPATLLHPGTKRRGGDEAAARGRGAPGAGWCARM